MKDLSLIRGLKYLNGRFQSTSSLEDHIENKKFLKEKQGNLNEAIVDYGCFLFKSENLDIKGLRNKLAKITIEDHDTKGLGDRLEIAVKNYEDSNTLFKSDPKYQSFVNDVKIKFPSMSNHNSKALLEKTVTSEDLSVEKQDMLRS
tara:strand:+ start:530 stop:967 length:438 start_codon:yes stop_codon:yes gene_type:complete